MSASKTTYLAKELGANDASTSPHESDSTIVELPVELFRSGLEEEESLSIGADLGSVEGIANVYKSDTGE